MKGSKIRQGQKFLVIIQNFNIVIYLLGLLSITFFKTYFMFVLFSQNRAVGADFSSQQQWIVFAQFGICNTENM